MVKRSVRVRLSDMLSAIDDGIEITSGLSFDDYMTRSIVRRALERCVEIVSEASRHIPPELKDQHPNAYWQEIKAVGNLLRHEYQRVDDLIMWRIETKYFPELRQVVATLLRQTEERR
jgi:uncharacterized protein with HEPN domain